MKRDEITGKNEGKKWKNTKEKHEQKHKPKENRKGKNLNRSEAVRKKKSKKKREDSHDGNKHRGQTDASQQPGSARGLIRRAGVTLGGTETAVHVPEGDGKGVGVPPFVRPFKCRSPTRPQPRRPNS